MEFFTFKEFSQIIDIQPLYYMREIKIYLKPDLNIKWGKFRESFIYSSSFPIILVHFFIKYCIQQNFLCKNYSKIVPKKFLFYISKSNRQIIADKLNFFRIKDNFSRI